MKLAVILPTVDGREAILNRTVEAYAASVSNLHKLKVNTELTLIRNAATVGEAWNAGAHRVLNDEDVQGLLFAIDDAIPHPSTLATAWETITKQIVAAPRIVLPDGSLESCGTMGAGCFLPECEDWTRCRSSGIPAVSREAFERVGDFLPIHYYSDDDWCWRADRLGWPTHVRRGYAFTHHHAIPRRAEMQSRALADRAAWLAHVARLDHSLEES